MSDAELDALDTGYVDDGAAAATAETTETVVPEVKETPAPDAGDKPVDDAPEAKTETDEDKRKLLPEQKLRQRAQAAEAEAATVRQQLETIQANQVRQQQQNEYNRLAAEEGEFAAQQYANMVNQQNAQRQKEISDAQAYERNLHQQENTARSLLGPGEYESYVDKVKEKYTEEGARMLAQRSGDPIAWVVKEGRSIETPAEYQAKLDKAVEKSVKESLSKLQDAPKGQKSIGHLSSTRSSGVDKHVNDMNEAELNQEEERLRALW
jgi:hypothetical protein